MFGLFDIVDLGSVHSTQTRTSTPSHRNQARHSVSSLRLPAIRSNRCDRYPSDGYRYKRKNENIFNRHVLLLLTSETSVCAACSCPPFEIPHGQRSNANGRAVDSRVHVRVPAVGDERPDRLQDGRNETRFIDATSRAVHVTNTDVDVAHERSE
jgi:hypothetical protein